MVEHAVARARRAPHRDPARHARTSCRSLRELVRHHDAPVYTITYYVHWLLMQAIHEHGYRVSVSGTAADELFTRLLRPPPRLPADGARRAGGSHERVAATPGSEHVAPIVRNPYPARIPTCSCDDPGVPRPHLPRRRRVRGLPDRRRSTSRSPRRDFADDLLRNRMLNELFPEAVPVILHEDDLNAMYFSIENRSPFLDRDAVRVLAVDPDAPPGARRHGEGGAARGDARHRARPDPRQPPQGRLQRPDRRACSTPTIPRCAPSCSADSPRLGARAARRGRGAARHARRCPTARASSCSTSLCAKLFLEEFDA